MGLSEDATSRDYYVSSIPTYYLRKCAFLVVVFINKNSVYVRVYRYQGTQRHANAWSTITHDDHLMVRPTDLPSLSIGD